MENMKKINLDTMELNNDINFLNEKIETKEQEKNEIIFNENKKMKNTINEIRGLNLEIKDKTSEFKKAKILVTKHRINKKSDLNVDDDDYNKYLEVFTGLKIKELLLKRDLETLKIKKAELKDFKKYLTSKIKRIENDFEIILSDIKSKIKKKGTLKLKNLLDLGIDIEDDEILD